MRRRSGAWRLGMRWVERSDPEAVAKAYHAYIADGRMDEARALATFENAQAEQGWTEWVERYQGEPNSGETAWEPEVGTVQRIEGPGGEWAVVNVEWRPLSGSRSAETYACLMREVEGQWSMHIGADRFPPKQRRGPPERESVE